MSTGLTLGITLEVGFAASVASPHLSTSELPISIVVILGLVFFCVSALSVVTGSTSLITVPILIQIGIEPQVAIATNMVTLTLMSMGATLPFLGKNRLDTQRLPWLIGLTLVSSAFGALLLWMLPSASVSPLIAFSMLVVVGLSIIMGDRGIHPLESAPSRLAIGLGYLSSFLLGIYGGLFSGGYVTLLMAVLVACFGHTFLTAIATSKVLNIFSSLVASLIFIRLGLVDYSLGVFLGCAMFLGGFFGSKIVLKINNRWLRRIYMLTVIGLAIRLFIR